jgi:hypothetical protein
VTQELTDEVITSSMIVSFHAALAVGERYRCGVLSSVDAKVEIQRHGVGIAVQGGHRCRLHGLQGATCHYGNDRPIGSPQADAVRLTV